MLYKAIMLTLIILTLGFAKQTKLKNTHQPLTKQMNADHIRLDVNNLSAWFTNSGSFFRNPFTGNSGLEYPIAGNVYAIYAAGLWIGGLVTDDYGNKDVRVAVAEYSYEYQPGTMNENGSWNDPQNPEFRMYKISREDYIAATDANQETVPGDDWLNWPVEQGAPTEIWLDDQNQPQVIPMLKGDQAIWTVYNDADPAVHVNMGSLPLGIEVGHYSWGYKSKGLKNVIFSKFTIINKSVQNIDSCYFSVWTDPDLGNSGDDFVGCDTVLDLGFCYNASNYDKEYGTPPPAVGFDYLQGPVVPSTGDTAVYNFSTKADYKNLPLSSFIYYNGSAANNGNLFNAQEVYNYMRAIWRDGTPITWGADGTTGTKRAYFMFPTDPENPEGDVWLDVAEGDRRFMQNTGPFNLAVGDTQEVVIAVLAATGNSNLNSVTKLKALSKSVQNVFDINFDVPLGPKKMEVSLSELDREIILSWDAQSEAYTEINKFIPETDEQGNPLQRDYHFQGYQIIQYKDQSFTTGEVIAIFDLDDEIKDIWDYPPNGEELGIRNQLIVNGTDSGIKRYLRITEDLFSGKQVKKLVNGHSYYFGVRAYAYTPDAPESEKVLFSPLVQITAQPKGTPIGVRYSAEFADSIQVTKNGLSDGFVIVQVIDPSKLTGLDYTINFEEDTVAADGSFFWKVTRSDGIIVLDHQTYQSESLNQNESFTVFDGLLAKVSSPPLSVKSFETVANGAGPIVPPTGAAADFQDYPVPERPGDSQQAGAGKWLITTLDNSIGVSFAGFMARTFQYTGGYGNASGIHHLIPRDFEIRFTATGGKALDNWGTGAVIDVPFELWDVGKLEDPSDDFQLFPYILDNDGNAEFNLMYDAEYPAGDTGWADHPISSATNDPYTDGIYWMHPTDNTPGTQGYDNLVAALESDPSQAPLWYSAPGDSPGAYDAWVGMHRMTLVNWNGGDVTTATSTADYNQEMPEIGTIFRIVTTKTNTDAVTFTFSAPQAYTTDLADLKEDLHKINVYPNPYYGGHAGEYASNEHWVRFTHLPPTCTIRIFTLAGGLVRTIKRKSADNPQENWNLQNISGYPVASGIYIYHVKIPGIGEKVGKLAIFQAVDY